MVLVNQFSDGRRALSRFPRFGGSLGSLPHTRLSSCFFVEIVHYDEQENSGEENGQENGDCDDPAPKEASVVPVAVVVYKNEPYDVQNLLSLGRVEAVVLQG